MTDQPANNGTVCHILPCSIEEDMTAPIAQYFHPTPLPANAMPPKNGSSSDATTTNYDDDHVTGMAAQFRGRGLLCAVDASSSSSGVNNAPVTTTTPLSKLPPNLMGVALSPSSSSSTAKTASKDTPMQTLKVVEKFQHVYNWSHEHDVKKVMRERHGSDKHGLNAVLGWCDLAHEVHDPIPVPP